MAFRHRSCVILLCDNCGHDGDDGGDYGAIHWSTEAEALSKDAEPMCANGSTDDDCGSPQFHTMPNGRVLCRRCAHRTLCVAGHGWSSWSEWFESASKPGQEARTRYCERCSQWNFQHRPKGGGT